MYFIGGQFEDTGEVERLDTGFLRLLIEVRQLQHLATTSKAFNICQVEANNLQRRAEENIHILRTSFVL